MGDEAVFPFLVLVAVTDENAGSGHGVPRWFKMVLLENRLLE